MRIVAHTMRGQLGGRKQFSGPRSIAKTTLSGLLSAVQQVGSQIESAVSAIWADAFVTSLRDNRFRGIVQTGHSDVANLRMLEGCLTLPANKNPCGHLSPQSGDSQKAGEHLCNCVSVPRTVAKAQSGVRCRPVYALQFTPTSFGDVYLLNVSVQLSRIRNSERRPCERYFLVRLANCVPFCPF